MLVKEWEMVNFKLGETNVKMNNQHVTSVGQRKNLIPRQDSNLWSPVEYSLSHARDLLIIHFHNINVAFSQFGYLIISSNHFAIICANVCLECWAMTHCNCHRRQLESLLTPIFSFQFIEIFLRFWWNVLSMSEMLKLARGSPNLVRRQNVRKILLILPLMWLWCLWI